MVLGAISSFHRHARFGIDDGASKDVITSGRNAGSSGVLLLEAKYVFGMIDRAGIAWGLGY